MEVHFAPDLQARIDQLVIETGRAPDKLLEDALAGYVPELAETREMLNNRYDDLKSGLGKANPRRRGWSLLPREERRRASFAARFVTGYDFHPEARSVGGSPHGWRNGALTIAVADSLKLGKAVS
jgi:hypothetical protein